MDDLPPINPDVDLTQILPIQQKRIVAFFNHFVMNTVTFLNTFAQSCESRLMTFELKIQKLEASVVLLESQLSSISGLDGGENETNKSTGNDSVVGVDLPDIGAPEPALGPAAPAAVSSEEEQAGTVVEEKGLKYCEDPRYTQYFKMVKVGVAAEAVKLKMKREGISPDILDMPNATVPVSVSLPDSR